MKLAEVAVSLKGEGAFGGGNASYMETKCESVSPPKKLQEHIPLDSLQTALLARKGTRQNIHEARDSAVAKIEEWAGTPIRSNTAGSYPTP